MWIILALVCLVALGVYVQSMKQASPVDKVVTTTYNKVTLPQQPPVNQFDQDLQLYLDNQPLPEVVPVSNAQVVPEIWNPPGLSPQTAVN